MRVFVTGATGFIGLPVVKELLGAGHKVLGLARSDDGAKALTALGAEIQRGSLEDLDSLRQGAASSDAVLHLAFIHDWSNFVASCEADRRAIEAMGEVLKGTDKPLSEQTALALAGVRASVMRLPQVHDTTKQGLITEAVAIARRTGISAYIGDGHTRWAAAHVSDVARLYRLALEQNEAGARYHAVGEEGVSMRDFAEAIGRGLNLPVKSITAEEAPGHFGFLAMFATHDLTASSEKTRKKLGWNPTGPGLIADLEQLQLAD
jgi:nucleoside-diphosphate-sugar epimerase